MPMTATTALSGFRLPKTSFHRRSAPMRQIQAIPMQKTFTTAECRQIAISALEALGNNRVKSLQHIERLTPKQLATCSTNGTVLGPVVTAFINAGVPNVGSVMRLLGADQNELDRALCFCVNADEMTGKDAAGRIRSLAN